jgi:beta-lactamase superfamily II metal-dependent hydrolase
MTLNPVNDALLQIFNVEHGACALLTTPAGPGSWHRVLIDCGHNATTGWYPGRHLRDLGVTFLDQLVITNYDEDHVSGYPDLLAQGLNVDWVFRNTSVTPATISHLKSETGMGRGINALVQSLSKFGPVGGNGKPAPMFAGVSMEYFYNTYPSFDDENNLSLVLYLKVYGTTFLFPGDMECDGFDHLLATNLRFRQVVTSINVLVASHHGRKNGICEDMFEKYGCKPQLVVISDDYKQYDTQETASYYASKATGIKNFRSSGANRRVLTTRTDGDIHFTWVNGQCTVY